MVFSYTGEVFYGFFAPKQDQDPQWHKPTKLPPVSSICDFLSCWVYHFCVLGCGLAPCYLNKMLRLGTH